VIALVLLLALPTPTERWGLEGKDAAFFEKVAGIAEEGANMRRARAYLDKFAKKPDGAVLRGLGCLFERKESTPNQKRNAHVLFLVLTGRDVATPDADVWFGIVEPLSRKHRKPAHPSQGEVRAAVLLGAQALYHHLDEHNVLRSAQYESQNKLVYGPPSIGETCIALLALHRSGLPKNNPALQTWLARCRALYGTKHYEKLYKEDSRFAPSPTAYRAHFDTVGLAWANAELGGEPIPGLDKKLYAMLSRHAKFAVGWAESRTGVLGALQAMKRAGLKLQDRPLADFEKWWRRRIEKAMPRNLVSDYWLHGVLRQLAVCVRLRRPETTAKQLRSDPLFSAFVERYPRYHGNAIANDVLTRNYWHLDGSLLDALELREVVIEGRRVNIALHDQSYLIRRQDDDGMFRVLPAHLGVSPPYRTAAALLVLCGGLTYRRGN